MYRVCIEYIESIYRVYIECIVESIYRAGISRRSRWSIPMGKFLTKSRFF